MLQCLLWQRSLLIPEGALLCRAAGRRHLARSSSVALLDLESFHLFLEQAARGICSHATLSLLIRSLLFLLVRLVAPPA